MSLGAFLSGAVSAAIRRTPSPNWASSPRASSERAARHKRADLLYRVILECDGPVAEARLEHVDWSVFRLDGEELHLTNTAVPALMTAGITVAEPTPVLDQP